MMMKILFVISCFLLSMFNVHLGLGYSKESFCLEEMTGGSLSLSCPTHQLIQLGRIVYGYSWSNECSYIDKDCTMDVPREEISCSSTSNCTIRVVEHPLILQDCWNLAASYIQAEFECISDYSLQNLCQNQESDLSQGYLSTPFYPHGFPWNLNCLCVLSPSVGHSIVVELIDFHLPTCSDAGLVLRLGEEIQTKCSTQNPFTLLGNPQQNLTLRFYSSINVTHGGFLIKYSLTPMSNNARVRLQCQMIISSGQRTINSFRSTSTDLLKLKETKTSNQSIDNKSSQLVVSSNPTMLIVSITSAFVFLLVIVNLFIWCLCALKPRRSKSNVYSDPTPPVPSVTRLKTLHSLLYLDRPTNDVQRTPSIGDLQSTDDGDELRTQCSSASSNHLTHGFIIKSKLNSLERSTTRQVQSWEDI